MILRQIDNFFPRLDLILPEIKKIKLYSVEEFNEIEKTQNAWPGFRSLNLKKTNVFLFELINNLMFTNKVIDKGTYDIGTYIHLRLEQHANKDWIHKDDNKFAGLIYLSDTNLNSGTYLYDKNNNIINDIKCVKNRFVIFSGDYNHKGYGHYGNNVQNGRLTFNLFIDDV